MDEYVHEEPLVSPHSISAFRNSREGTQMTEMVLHDHPFIYEVEEVAMRQSIESALPNCATVDSEYDEHSLEQTASIYV